MEYAGPAQGFRDRLDAWTAGRVTSSHKGTRRLDVPVRGELLLGFGTDPKRSGQQVLVHSVWLNGRYGDGGGHSTMDVGQGPLHERRVATWQPTWPLEIRDGQETLLWGIFVDEPAGDPPASLEERAKRAAAAWLYRVGTAEAPAEKQSD